jgi:hypothetical protein
MTAVTCRPVNADDDDVVRRLFLATMLLGRPLHRPVTRLAEYAELSLGWYLGPGRPDAAVAVDRDGRIVGYALVCTHESAAARWQTTHAARLAALVAADFARGRVDAPSRVFWASRATDVFALARTKRTAPAEAHAHLNIDRSARQGSAALALLAHVDECCRVAGLDRWYGEINERVGRRAGAIERLGGRVVGRESNHSFSKLLGEPVERLTVVRDVVEVRPTQAVAAATAVAHR